MRVECTPPAARFLPADLVVWAAGIQAPAILASLDGLEVNRLHQLVVTETLQTTRDPDVFAFGDCAACPWPGAARRTAGAAEGASRPPAGFAPSPQHACAAGGKAAAGIYFRDFGSLVSLGELSAVGNLMGRLIGGSMFIQGLIARGMYASLYKLHQISIYGYVRVAFDTVGRFLRRRMEPRVKLH